MKKTNLFASYVCTHFLPFINLGILSLFKVVPFKTYFPQNLEYPNKSAAFVNQ